jgi:hypothetical protein
VAQEALLKFERAAVVGRGCWPGLFRQIGFLPVRVFYLSKLGFFLHQNSFLRSKRVVDLKGASCKVHAGFKTASHMSFLTVGVEAPLPARKAASGLRRASKTTSFEGGDDSAHPPLLCGDFLGFGGAAHEAPPFSYPATKAIFPSGPKNSSKRSRSTPSPMSTEPFLAVLTELTGL